VVVLYLSHVDPIYSPLGTDCSRGEHDIEPATAAEIDHRFALPHALYLEPLLLTRGTPDGNRDTYASQLCGCQRITTAHTQVSTDGEALEIFNAVAECLGDFIFLRAVILHGCLLGELSVTVPDEAVYALCCHISRFNTYLDDGMVDFRLDESGQMCTYPDG
jgi:hypothetical protein